MKKRQLIYLLLVISIIIFTIPEVSAAEEFYFCNSESINAFRVIGEILYVIKIVVPLIIIVLASVDFSRAVLSNDEKAVSVSAKALLRRLIAGIIVFFVPTLVYAILDMLSPATGEGSQEQMQSSYVECTKCMFNPSVCDELKETLPDSGGYKSSNKKANRDSNSNKSDNKSNSKSNDKQNNKSDIYNPKDKSNSNNSKNKENEKKYNTSGGVK